MSVSACGGTTTTAYTYDNNGNNISRTITEPNGNTSTTTNTYDSSNRLVGVVDGAYTASYAYNTAGLRIQKSVTKNNVTTTEKFLTDSGNVVLETSANGTQTAYDVYGPEGIISRKTSAGTLYYLYNGHGDVTQLTNSSGNVIIAYTYDAFGNMTTNTANDTNPYRYCGEYFDVETETYYLRARYYSPATGRFTQRDSFGGYYNDPLSLNRYTYGHNNPIKYSDPSGHAATERELAKLLSADVSVPKSMTDAWKYGDKTGNQVHMKAADAYQAAFAAQKAAEKQVSTQLVADLIGKNETILVDSGKAMPMTDALKRTPNLEPINYGSKGSSVQNMQSMLDSLGYYSGLVFSENYELNGGYFGYNTLNALMRFQLQNGWVWEDLFISGVYIGCDQNTLGKLITAKYGMSGIDYSYNGKGLKVPSNNTTMLGHIVCNKGSASVPSDLLSLMNAPINSNWGISDSAAEAWFLSTNTAVINKYGLNSTNIGEVTTAIKAAGVSPVFFYAYTVNEGGGLGGFINHYGKNYYANNGGDTAVNAASGDAQYIADQSKIMDSRPAWGDLGQKNPSLRVDFVPQSVKTDGNRSFASMPSGSIGRIYIPATAAATWEVYYPQGLSKSYNQVQNYSAPLQGVLSFIKAMSKY